MLLRLPVDSSLPEYDCLFLIMFRQIAETVLRKKNYKKDYFLMGRLRIESSPDLSLPPCIYNSIGLGRSASAVKI
jgi:hypothetical protein